MAGGTHSGVMRAQWWPQSVEYSSRTPWEKDVDLLQPMLSSNCRKEEPDTSKSQLSAYLGFSAEGTNRDCVDVYYDCKLLSHFFASSETMWEIKAMESFEVPLPFKLSDAQI